MPEISPKISMDDANHNLQEFMLANNDEEANRNLEKGLLYLLNNVHNEGVVETESGVAI